MQFLFAVLIRNLYLYFLGHLVSAVLFCLCVLSTQLHYFVSHSAFCIANMFGLISYTISDLTLCYIPVLFSLIFKFCELSECTRTPSVAIRLSLHRFSFIRSISNWYARESLKTMTSVSATAAVNLTKVTKWDTMCYVKSQSFCC